MLPKLSGGLSTESSTSLSLAGRPTSSQVEGALQRLPSPDTKGLGGPQTVVLGLAVQSRFMAFASECVLYTCLISTAWELVRNAPSQIC